MSIAQLAPFDLLVAPPWLLPQVIGNGIQYEFTRGQYWLGSGLTAESNVLADTRSSDALFDSATGVYSTFGPNVPAITDRGLYPGGQVTVQNYSSMDFSAASGWGSAATFSLETRNSVIEGETAQRHLGNNIASQGRNQVRTLDAAGVHRLDAIIEEVSGTLFDFGILQNVSPFGWLGLGRFTWSTQAITAAAGTIANAVVENLGTGPNGGRLRRVSLTVDTGAMESVQFFFYPNGTAANTLETIVHYYAAYPGTVIRPLIRSPNNAKFTRLADSITNPNFAAHAAAFGFANGMAALARVNLTRLSDPSARRIMTFGTAADGVYIEFTTANTFKAVLRKAGADAVPLTSGTVSATGVYDVTAQFKAGDYSLTVSGGIAGATSASAETLPAAIASAAYIGQKEDTTLHTESPLERLAMWGVAA